MPAQAAAAIAQPEDAGEVLTTLLALPAAESKQGAHRQFTLSFCILSSQSVRPIISAGTPELFQIWKPQQKAMTPRAQSDQLQS